MAGAPKGNTNALKHGLYAKHFRPEDKAELRRMAWNDLLYEIMAGRNIAERAMRIIDQEMGFPVVDTLKASIAIKVFMTVVTGIGALATRHGILNGKDPNLNDSFVQALSELPAFAEEDESDPR